MKMQKNIWVFVMAGLFIPFQLFYADQCDDIFAKAKRISGSARQAANQKDYNRAVKLYEEAGQYYEQIANIPKCRCPKIHRASQNNAKLCRENADKYRKWMEEYKSEVKLYEQYNQAKEIYNEGNTYARSRQWDKAIVAFEEAVQI